MPWNVWANWRIILGYWSMLAKPIAAHATPVATRATVDRECELPPTAADHEPGPEDPREYLQQHDTRNAITGGHTRSRQRHMTAAPNSNSGLALPRARPMITGQDVNASA